jgi:hypothetical protein
MKTSWLYRIAAVLLAIFDAGHTFIFLTFKPSNPDGQAVMEAMNRVHFQIFGGSLTYGDLYVGFGLVATVYLAFAAYLAWHLSGLARTAQAIGGLRWMFPAAQAGVFILAWIYFTGPPIWFAGAIAVCLTWAALALPKEIAP